jgi:hypothetical protein
VDPQLRAARATLLLAVVLTGIGACGVHRGSQELSDQSMEVPTGDDSGGSALDRARADAAAALIRAVLAAPYRRPIAAGNILVSAMLFVGGVMLILRRGSAVWFTTQAIAANVVWTIADGTSVIVQLIATRAEVARVIDDEINARVPGAGAELVPGDIYVLFGVLLGGGFAIARAALYMVLLWRLRRPDIGRVIRLADEERRTND